MTDGIKKQKRTNKCPTVIKTQVAIDHQNTFYNIIIHFSTSDRDFRVLQVLILSLQTEVRTSKFSVIFVVPILAFRSLRFGRTYMGATCFLPQTTGFRRDTKNNERRRHNNNNDNNKTYNNIMLYVQNHSGSGSAPGST